jgi:uncharacterized protein
MNAPLTRMGASAAARLVAATLLLVIACAQAAAAAAPERYTQGLLWKVEAQGVAPSYVFGTAHVADPRVTRLPEPVRAAFDSATSFAMEVTLNKPFEEYGKRMVYTGKRNLPAALGQRLYDQIAPVALKAGVPREVLPHLRPWAVLFVLTSPRDDPSKVLDHQLYLRARAQKKPVYELETVAESFAPFANLSESDQIVLLRDALEHHARIPEIHQRVIETYLKGDLAALMRMTEEGIGDGPKSKLHRFVLMRLNDERNVNMARRMDVLAKRGGAFMALGALHLYGEQGVLALLEKRGHRLTRVY